MTGFTTAPPTTLPPQDETAESSSSPPAGGSSSSSTTEDSGSGHGSEGSNTSAAHMTSTGSPVPDFGTAAPPGCQGKIDFLFVISSWYSMKSHQAQLQEAFPAFIEIIESDFTDFDYHIMVVDAAGIGGLSDCKWCYTCQNVTCDGPGCSDWGGPADYPCNEEYQACDWYEGAGVTMPGNFGASNKRCELHGDGQRYIIKSEPNLEEAFQCISMLGEGPKPGPPIYSMMAALQPEMLGPGGCNEGFLREDALLVVVVIQGQTDDITPGYPKDWWYFLQEKKGYNKDAIVALVISQDSTEPDAWCEGFEQLNTLRTFADTVKHGRFESICAPTYVPFLQEGAELILDLCSQLIPQ